MKMENKAKSQGHEIFSLVDIRFGLTHQKIDKISSASLVDLDFSKFVILFKFNLLFYFIIYIILY